MKTIIRLLLLLFVIGTVSIKSHAQTVSATINWQFNLGTAGQAATYSTATSDFFNLNWVEIGSNLTYKSTAINFGDTLTTFQPVVTTGAGDSTSANLVSFNFSLKTGVFFTPTSISLDCGRYGTDGGLIKLAWKSSDGKITILQSNIKPNRINTSSTPPIYPTHLTYDLSSLNIPVSEGNCGFYIYIYSLGNTKTVGVGNVTIKGNLTGNTTLKDASTIAWNAPQPIAYGTPLSSEQLNAIITGSTSAITYTPAIGTILNAGYQTLTVNVAEDATYAAAKQSVTLQVYPESSNLSWNPPASIIYGTSLNSLFNASVTGTTGAVTYIPDSETILPAGTYAISVLFSADENHCAAGDITSITITKALSTITWDNPVDIISGTPLSATQLNATVTGTAGSAEYSPSLGTVLPIGNHTLTVTFNGDANYESATKSVTINVTGTVSVETLTSDNISICPNPFSDMVTIKVIHLSNNYSLTVTNTKGNIIFYKFLTSESTELNLKDLPAGTYLFQLLSKKGKIVKQIVKQ